MYVCTVQWPPRWGRQGAPTLLRSPAEAEADKAAAAGPQEEKSRYLVIKMGPGGVETFDLNALPESLSGKGTPISPGGKAEVFIASGKEAEALNLLSLGSLSTSSLSSALLGSI